MLKNRKKPTEHRQGVLVELLDLIQRFSTMHHEKDFYDVEREQINSKYQEEIEDMMRELRAFDITEIGNLYLTSGGQVVLDKGYGEYFSKADTVIFSLKELKSGMPYKKFKNKIDTLRDEKC